MRATSASPIIALIGLSGSLHAQNTYPWPQTGNVGIGSSGSSSYRLSVVPPGDGTMNALYLGVADGFNEGAEIDWKGSGSYPSWVTDIFQNTFRVFSAAPSDIRLDVFNSGSGSANLYVEGNVGIGTSALPYKLTVQGSAGFALSQGQSVELSGVGSNTIQQGPNLLFTDSSVGATATVLQQGTSGGFGIWTYDGGWAERMHIAKNGDVGIGTTGPGARVDVRGLNAQATYSVASGVPEDLRVLASNNRPLDGGIITIGGAWGATGYIKTAAYDGRAGALIIGNRRSPSDETMQPGIVLDQAGRVGIGTTSPSHPLSVKGTIRAQEIIVDTGWADYVFAENYRLAPLSEVEAHIKAHKHLPGVPSAAEVAEKGVSMGEMQARMMAKIEELTLHVIEQEKRARDHERRARAQEEEIATLRAEVARLSTSN